MFRLRRHQWPKLLDLVALHVQQAASLRRVKPLVQTGTEIVAAEILLFEIKLCERVRTINDRLDSLCTRDLADRFHGSDLARDVHLMRNENEFCSTRDSIFKCCCDLVEILWRDRDLYELEYETLATFTLSQRGQHARVVLRRGEYLVARFEIHSHEQDLKRLRSITRDRDLFAIAAEHLGEARANRFRLWLEYLPHRVRGRVFLLPDVTDERFGDDARARRHTAIVEIHNPACDGERILNDGPVVFIHRRLLGRERGHAARCGFDFLHKRADSWCR